MRLGEKTHHILADYLRLLATKQGAVSLEDIIILKQNMAKIIQQEFTAAEQKDYSSYDKNQKFGFKEFCYNEELPDNPLEQAIQRVNANLDAFIASDMKTKVLQYFQNDNKYYIESNESDFEQMKLILDHHPILEHVTIRAWPDFGVTADNGIYYIYDRKSWREKDVPTDSITDQLKIYAYKLLCNTNKTLDDITIYTYEVYVPSMNMIGGKVTQADIDSIKDKVIDDVHELQELVEDKDIQKNIPKHVDTFQRTINSQKCAICSFRKACASLKKIDGDATQNPILDDLMGQRDDGRLF